MNLSKFITDNKLFFFVLANCVVSFGVTFMAWPSEPASGFQWGKLIMSCLVSVGQSIIGLYLNPPGTEKDTLESAVKKGP